MLILFIYTDGFVVNSKIITFYSFFVPRLCKYLKNYLKKVNNVIKMHELNKIKCKWFCQLGYRP